MRRWRYIKPQTASCCLVRASAEDVALVKALRRDMSTHGCNPCGFPANDDRLQGLFTNGSTESFHEGDGMIFAGVATFALALTPSEFAYTRQNTWRCDPKINTDRVSLLLGHQLRSAPFPVQATGVFRYKAANNACAYVPTGGATAEEALVETETTRY